MLYSKSMDTMGISVRKSLGKKSIPALIFNNRVLIMKSDAANLKTWPAHMVVLEDPDWFLAEEHLLKVAAMIQEQEIEP